MVATISAVSAIIVAVITTFSTIAVSKSETQRIRTELNEIKPDAKKVKEELKDISDLEKIANLPVGTIIASMLEPADFAREVGDVERTKKQWEIADGREIDTASDYCQLTKKTKIPDLRGMFLRGMNVEGAGADPDKNREVGTSQEDAFQKHDHEIKPDWPLTGYEKKAYERGDANEPGYTKHADGKDAPKVETLRTTVAGTEDETRPKNVAVYFYIKIN
jgi:hypothetical protein